MVAIANYHQQALSQVKVNHHYFLYDTVFKSMTLFLNVLYKNYLDHLKEICK